MELLRPGAPASIEVDMAPLGFVPIEATFVVLNELGAIVQPSSPASMAVGKAVAEVTADTNTLAADALMGAREVVLTFTAPSGRTSILRHSYGLQAEDVLQVPFRSTLTRLQSDMLAHQIPEVRASWFEYDTAARTAALQSAFFKLSEIRFIDRDRADDRQYAGYGMGFAASGLYRLSTITESEWLSMSPQLRAALQRAQLLQAFDDLAALSAGSSAGVDLSVVAEIKVGESTTKFRDRSASATLGSRARAALRRYMTGVRIGRA